MASTMRERESAPLELISQFPSTNNSIPHFPHPLPSFSLLRPFTSHHVKSHNHPPPTHSVIAGLDMASQFGKLDMSAAIKNNNSNSNVTTSALNQPSLLRAPSGSTGSAASPINDNSDPFSTLPPPIPSNSNAPAVSLSSSKSTDDEDLFADFVGGRAAKSD